MRILGENLPDFDTSVVSCEQQLFVRTDSKEHRFKYVISIIARHKKYCLTLLVVITEPSRRQDCFECTAEWLAVNEHLAVNPLCAAVFV